MCFRDNDSPRFIRRRDAAVSFMEKLLDEGELSGPEALKVTSDKFVLRSCWKDDYRIYKALWALLGE